MYFQNTPAAVTLINLRNATSAFTALPCTVLYILLLAPSTYKLNIHVDKTYPLLQPHNEVGEHTEMTFHVCYFLLNALIYTLQPSTACHPDHIPFPSKYWKTYKSTQGINSVFTTCS